MLDALLPYVNAALTDRRRDLAGGFEALVADRPRIVGAFDASAFVRSTKRVRRSAATKRCRSVALRASRETLAETYELAQQFLPGLAAPPGTS